MRDSSLKWRAATQAKSYTATLEQIDHLVDSEPYRDRSLEFHFDPTCTPSPFGLRGHPNHRANAVTAPRLSSLSDNLSITRRGDAEDRGRCIHRNNFTIKAERASL